MPQTRTDSALAALRAVKDLGGPTQPVPSHQSPTSKIEAVSPFKKLMEKVLPLNSEEPLAQHGVLNALIGHGETHSAVPSIEEIGGMSPMMGTVKKLPVISPEAYNDVKAGGLRLYSRLTDAFAKAPSAMKPAKAISIAQSGASKEEIGLRKLGEFLKAKQPMQDIPREEIMQHLAANPLELDVVRKGGSSQIPDIDSNEFPGLRNAEIARDRYVHELDTNPDIGPNVFEDELERRFPAEYARLRQLANEVDRQRELIQGVVRDAHNNPARYDYLQTPGPKENYGETLINLPVKPEIQDVKSSYNELLDRNTAEVLASGHFTPEEIARIQQDENLRMQMRDDIRRNTFQSPHWDEPNNLVWSRHNDRRLNPTETYIGGELGNPTPEALGGSKGRFVEEIQSDWHQQGREKGYKSDPLPEITIDHYTSPNRTAYGDAPADNYRADWQGPDVRHSVFGLSEEEALNNAKRNIDSYRVPDAPFKDTYHELALKQQLLDAAEDPELEWLGVADADTVSRMEGHSEIRPGTELYYNEKHPSALEKLLKPLGGEVEHANLPPFKVGNDIKWGPAPGHPDAIEIGLPGAPTNSGVEPIVTALPGNNHHSEAASYLANQIKNREVPGSGMWKASLTPELKELIKTRGFPAMTALLALQQGLKPNRPEE